MNQSQEISDLVQSLFSVQHHLQPVIKDANNPYYGNDYATLNCVLDTCRDILFSHGILMMQHPCAAPVELGAGHIGLETRFTHVQSGQWLSSTAVIPLPKNDPQGMGSAITYARRYSLCAMLGIVTEDDDGNAASNPEQKQSKLHSAKPQGQKPVHELPKSSSGALPKLDGVSYKNVQAEDGRMCVVATGVTLDKKELLKAAGFKWNSQQKVWWKYAATA